MYDVQAILERHEKIINDNKGKSQYSYYITN